MGLRIIAYPAFRDAAGGDGFAADCLVSQGVGSPGYYFPMCENPRHRRQPETPNVWVRGANGRRVSRGRFRVVGCGAFRLDFDGGLGGEAEETALFLPVMRQVFAQSQQPGWRQ